MFPVDFGLILPRSNKPETLKSTRDSAFSSDAVLVKIDRGYDYILRGIHTELLVLRRCTM